MWGSFIVLMINFKNMTKRTHLQGGMGAGGTKKKRDYRGAGEAYDKSRL